ncbi:hypothetical protein [Mycolicibacterium tusciae]|jgi:hypothetical protein|uniref:Uncharacterized protein n=1 Tax=Mycolicibacterium tusciae TaxID=75922 RepID=A0A1X0JKG3_9MYCO|nr:hypothetical protein [Mycolicibacterium tusciae]ORB63378.1 hypothetical protein BST47_19685 [Mycolicibacterium tusciae]
MTGIALFALAGLLYVLATLRREWQVSYYGDLRQDDMKTVLTFAAVTVSVFAVAIAALSMVLQT